MRKTDKRLKKIKSGITVSVMPLLLYARPALFDISCGGLKSVFVSFFVFELDILCIIARGKLHPSLEYVAEMRL